MKSIHKKLSNIEKKIENNKKIKIEKFKLK
jgi:hypothetical protein